MTVKIKAVKQDVPVMLLLLRVRWFWYNLLQTFKRKLVARSSYVHFSHLILKQSKSFKTKLSHGIS